jgi:hypothetical protein
VLGTSAIRQAGKAQSLATTFGVLGERCATTMTPVVYGELQAARKRDDVAGQEAYQSGIGSLLHMAQCVPPENAAPVGELAAFCAALTAAHHVAMLNVIRYVGCTSDRGITYGHKGVPGDMWCDENFAACLETCTACLDEWSCVLGVRCLERAASSRRKRHPPWTPSTRQTALQRERRCRFENLCVSLCC